MQIKEVQEWRVRKLWIGWKYKGLKKDNNVITYTEERSRERKLIGNWYMQEKLESYSRLDWIKLA